MNDPKVAALLRGLMQVWLDFSSRLDQVPLITKLLRGRMRIEDYRAFLLNHRQQVIEGSRWIARAASSITHEHAELRSIFLRHAVAEHRDYRLLEENFLAVGGQREAIEHYEKNIGTEILHAFMWQRATEPNPFDLLGAMFIIEGLGQHKARAWAAAIQQQLQLPFEAVSFLSYHGENDADHMQMFDTVLSSGILEIPKLDQRILTTARITAKLYLIQLEEIGLSHE